MKVQFFILMVLLGVVLAVHLAMNSKVGAVLKNPPVGNALFWCIGAVTAVIIGLFGWEKGALTPLKDVNPLLFFAGALGACLVFAIAWIVPKVGVGNVMILLLSGQVIGGLVMSHFGWLGSDVEKITVLKVVGVIVMVGGVILATMVKPPAKTPAPPSGQVAVSNTTETR